MVLDSDKYFLISLVFSFLFTSVITMYFAINHQQKVDEQILSNKIHMINTTNKGVEKDFKKNYHKNKSKLGRFDYYNQEFNTNPSFIEWNKLANYIYGKYNNYDAFIIIINKDNLILTSNALAFMLEGLDKPIIFTDGNNVFASLLLSSQTKIPEVMISSNNKLYRAVRRDDEPLNNNNCLSINYNQKINIKKLYNLVIPTLKVLPGMDESYINSFVNDENINGIIIELLGNVTNDNFLKVMNQLTEKGIVIVCIPQNKISIDIRLIEVGCLNGGNISIETAYIKLAFLLSNVSERKLIGKLMETNFRGELELLTNN